MEQLNDTGSNADAFTSDMEISDLMNLTYKKKL